MSTTPSFHDQSHPFWAFVADLNEQGPEHPFFAHGDAERLNRWSRRMRGGPMRMRGGPHGPGHHHHDHPRHARFAQQQDEEMRDLMTSDTDVEVKTATPCNRCASRTPDESDALVSSGDEGQRGPCGRRGGGGRGRGRGMGFHGGRGGRFAHAGPTDGPSDGENFTSGDEFHHGHGKRRGGGRFAGRGRGFGGPRARAATNDREVLFDATAPGQSDEENAVSGDETQRGFNPRKGLAMARSGRGRGGMMGKGPGGPHEHGKGKGINRHGGTGGPRAHGPHAHGPHTRGPHTHGPHAHGPHAHGPHGHGPRGMNRQGRMAGLGRSNRHADGKYRPEVDVFDHSEAYIVHVSIAGAKKKDIQVNWNAEKSALLITGTINRPEDEEVLKTLSTKERNVGEFKRAVRLGNKGTPAQVDVDGMKAKIEDGVLRIEVPKIEGGFVEVKKVDVA